MNMIDKSENVNHITWKEEFLCGLLVFSKLDLDKIWWNLQKHILRLIKTP